MLSLTLFSFKSSKYHPTYPQELTRKVCASHQGMAKYLTPILSRNQVFLFVIAHSPPYFTLREAVIKHNYGLPAQTMLEVSTG
jgi:hypothetical protein